MAKLTGAQFLKSKLSHISHHPGVYRMLDENGIVLYVGKAKDLRKRLTNYTQENRLSYRIQQMVHRVHDLITIETAGEAEAFLLEAELIKQFRPYYNILLKDDKSYPYILLTKEQFPRLVKYRGPRNKEGTYFGPFDSGFAVNNTIKELQKIFQIRSCTNTYFAQRKRPCLLYQIKRCSGPCCGCISVEQYAKSAKQVSEFMQGKSSTLQMQLTKMMQAYSAQEEFEKAAAVRDKIVALNHVQGTLQTELKQETDVIALAEKNGVTCLQVFFHRNKLSSNIFQIISDFHVEDLDAFLMQIYDKISPPEVICLSEKVSTVLANALHKLTGKKVQIQCPPFRGVKRQLMKQALRNAEQTLDQSLQKEKINIDVWGELQKLLGIQKLQKIEVYDNSHIQGTSAVGAMIAATIAGFDKNLYRRFNINLAETNNDFGMMQEVLTRRLKRGLKENDLPDAIILDGGKGQLSEVLKVMDEMGVDSIKVMAMAKGAGQHDKGLETLFLSDNPTTPIVPDHKSQLMFLLQRLRDEAHRYAIGSHRQKRAKAFLHSSLDDIEGIGAKRKKLLLAHFGSVRAISGASLEGLKKVAGLDEKIAKKVYTFFHE